HVWRKTLTKTRVVGITGTAGKTTVKEVLAQILTHKGSTAKNHLNMNNQIGLPLSMLAATGDEDYWVMEAGISQPGDMDELGAILEPDLGVIINVGPGHAAGLGDKGTAHYKARLLAHLAAGGSGLISADYPDLVREARAVRPDLAFFSTTGRQVDYRSAYVVPAGEGKGLFRLWLDGECVDAEVPFRGSFGAENVIAAAAAAHRLGLTAPEIAAGLTGVVLPKQRFACSRAGKWLVIDDSYNANPLSFARMLEAAREMTAERPGEPLICVLGAMGELGALAQAEHEQLGRLLAEARPKAIFWKGEHFEDVAEGLRYGRYDGVLQAITSTDALLESLTACGALAVKTDADAQVATPSVGKAGSKAGGVMLFKGSRVNKLEVFVQAFIAAAGEAHAV
ncbi:MAG: Mur ligase family protein, partial [Bilophila sp.]